MTSSDWHMTFIGTGPWRPFPRRGLPAVRLDAGGVSVLFDCGDGTLDRLLLKGGTNVDVVLLCSTSAASITGLLMLAETHRADRQRPLRVAGPVGTIDRVTTLSRLSSAPDGLFILEELNPGEVVADLGGLYVEAIRSETPRSACLSYVVIEPSLPGRFDVDAAARHGISGPDFGRLSSGQTVRGVRPEDVMGPRRLGRRLFINGRGRTTPEMDESLEGADVAVFAAPFMDERLEVAEELGYMTGWEAAHLATNRRVRTVMLYQLTPSAPVAVHVAEARQFHRSVHAPRPGQVLAIPLPEVGPPALQSDQRPTQRPTVSGGARR